MVTSLFTLLCTGLLIVYIVAPLFDGQTEVQNEETIPPIMRDQRDRLVQVLKDLELDYQLGNVSPQEYESASASVRVELAQVLEQIGKNTGKTPSLEASEEAA